MGGVFEPHWVANAHLKPGSPRTIELLPRHNLLAPLGAWSLGKTDRQVVKPPHQANNKETRNHQPYSLLLGTSEQCVLASLTTSSKSMMPGKPPSSTVSCPNSRSTSPPFRRHLPPRKWQSQGEGLHLLLAGTQARRARPLRGRIHSAQHPPVFNGASLSGDCKDPLSPPLDPLWTSKHLQRLHPHTLRYSRG